MPPVGWCRQAAKACVLMWRSALRQFVGRLLGLRVGLIVASIGGVATIRDRSRRPDRRAHGSDFLNSKTVPSAVIMPSISDATTLRTSIAARENRIAATSTPTDVARYRFDALSIQPLPAMRVDSPQEGAPTRRAIWWRAGGDPVTPSPAIPVTNSLKANCAGTYKPAVR